VKLANLEISTIDFVCFARAGRIWPHWWINPPYWEILAEEDFLVVFRAHGDSFRSSLGPVVGAGMFV
jgi:hypothetical protein